jgi:NAD(P)-dependent dehydrogenase (short-subunit alcohol dehydrogenase family)
VTGGANGLGKEICRELAKLGCNVAVVDIDFISAKETAESLRTFGIVSKAYKVDVSNFDEILALKKEILEDIGEVDFLVNNAGIIDCRTLLEQPPEDIERIIKVNINGVILVSFLIKFHTKNKFNELFSKFR